MEAVINFLTLDRNSAPERLTENAARLLQRVNVSRRPGYGFRDNGAARTQIGSTATTLTAAAVVRQQNGKLIVVDSNTAGTIRITPGDGSETNRGPLPEWNDSAVTEDP